MLVENVMTSPVVTVAPGMRLDEAYALMRRRNIRHLPVVEHDALTGIVTDRDLRLATSALSPQPFDASGSVADIMSTPPITASPIEPVEEAARTMISRRIGCLPVEVDGALVGIVTGTDLLESLIQLTGASRASSRIEVRLRQRSDLPGLARLLDERGVTVLSMLTHEDEDGDGSAVLRIDTIDPRALVRAISDMGMQVLWPRLR